MDAAELRSFFENTASYIEIPVFPASAPFAAMMFPYFQRHPYRALEFKQPSGQRSHNGTALCRIHIDPAGDFVGASATADAKARQIVDHANIDARRIQKTLSCWEFSSLI
jgi:hypothetical protein